MSSERTEGKAWSIQGSKDAYWTSIGKNLFLTNSLRSLKYLMASKYRSCQAEAITKTHLSVSCNMSMHVQAEHEMEGMWKETTVSFVLCVCVCMSACKRDTCTHAWSVYVLINVCFQLHKQAPGLHLLLPYITYVLKFLTFMRKTCNMLQIRAICIRQTLQDVT